MSKRAYDICHRAKGYPLAWLRQMSKLRTRNYDDYHIANWQFTIAKDRTSCLLTRNKLMSKRKAALLAQDSP